MNTSVKWTWFHNLFSDDPKALWPAFKINYIAYWTLNSIINCWYKEKFIKFILSKEKITQYKTRTKKVFSIAYYVTKKHNYFMISTIVGYSMLFLIIVVLFNNEDVQTFL